MENKIIELRNWFRTHGKMDFELNKKLPKEEHGKHITYKCKDIEDAFTRALGDSSHESAALPLHDVSKSLIASGKLALAARLVTTANAKNISQRIKQMEEALDTYDNEIITASNVC